MLSNYLKIAIRQIRRQNIYSIINLLGLTVSMSCVLLLFIYIREELSFDRFHEKTDTLYRIASHANINGNEINTPATPSGLASKLDVKNICRISTLNDVIMGSEYNLFREDDIYFIESTFFELFNFKILAGEIHDLSPQQIVLTSTLSQKLFGDSDVIGRTIRFNSKKLRIAAIIETPTKSHFNFSALILNPEITENWSEFSVYTYFHTSKDSEEINLELKEIYDQYMSPIFEANNSTCRFELQKVTDIHLNSHLRGELATNASRINIVAFILIGAFLLLVAGINYSNMATARSLRRSKEIGIRKAIGSYRSELVLQFLVESVLLVFFGIFLSLIIVDQILPYFNLITGFDSYEISQFDLELVLFVVLIVAIIGILGGLYPAIMMSKFSASDILKGTFIDYSNKLTTRKLLVIIQFFISLLMIICTWIVSNQIKFINNRNLGFNTDKLLTIEINSMSEKWLTELKDGINKTGLVSGICLTEEIPGEKIEKLSTFTVLDKRQETHEILAKYFSADQAFIENFEIALIHGNNFNHVGNSKSQILVNHQFTDQIGIPNPVGLYIQLPFKNTYGQDMAQIVGVINDFHFRSLHQQVQPLVIMYNEFNDHLVIKLRETESSSLETLRSEWHDIYPDDPFDYEFIEDKIDYMYRAELGTGRIFGAFAFITSLLAGLGLFSLSYYTAELKRKEIGIRKINGAETQQILLLIIREYFVLVAFGTIISWPISYLIMEKWLDGFAYRIQFDWTIYLFSLIIAFSITLVAVGLNSLKAAKAKILTTINRN